MDYLTRIQQAVDFIEEHLKDELPIERVAREAYFSMWHFHRVFGAIVGLGVKEYVRKRRLTLAMAELAGRSGGLLILRWTISLNRKSRSRGRSRRILV